MTEAESLLALIADLNGQIRGLQFDNAQLMSQVGGLLDELKAASDVPSEDSDAVADPA